MTKATQETPREEAFAAAAQPEIPADNATGVPVTDSQPRNVGLMFFAQTNAWRTDEQGNRTPAMELMGGFVYKMQQAGRLADLEENYRKAFEQFIES